MNAPYPRRLLLEKRHSVSTAIHVVSGVEAQAQLIGREEREETVHLFGSFHMASSMMMECHPKSGRLTLGNHLADDCARRVPLRIVPRQLISLFAPPGHGISIRHYLVRQDEQPSARIADQAG